MCGEPAERAWPTRRESATIGHRTFTLLYDEERAKMCAWIRTRGVDADTAADLAHDAFLRLWTTCGRDVDDPRAYLYRTLGNLLKNHFKHADVATGCDDAFLPRPTRFPAPDEVLAGREMEKVIERTLAAMARGAREVMRRHLSGEGATEIAWSLGTTPATVHVQLHRARAALAKAIPDWTGREIFGRPR